MKYILLFFPAIFFYCHLQSQTLIINELSNGAAGNQEYVEFLVASNTVTYNCNNSTPPCIDIRGWIFDDNSGLHGGISGTGVAAGAVRFSQNSLWSCVPLGTIILLYNNGDKNPAIPADDLTMADGNCTIVVPVNSPNLFETNTTTPGAVACSYPATGWTAVGNWSTTVLANSGDCARIVNLSGCEVFSVCYGTANTNNLIYYAGNGGQTVYYFNGTDPANQTNWSVGSASSNPADQTPGAPNNALNAAYIAQFNNGCMPITPLAISTPTLVNASCLCDGSATVNASGSIGGYTYSWYDSNSLSIGQTSSTANGLCAGVYKVVATSFIGCKDSINVTILASSSTPSVNINNQTICAGGSAILTATPSTIGGTYLWTPGGQTTQTISVSPANTTTYSVTYSISACTVTNTAIVSVNTSPVIILTTSSPSICASGQTATLSLSGSSGTYTWSNGGNASSTTINTPGVYTATVSTPSCGSASTSITVGASPLPTVSISVPTTTLCSGSALTFTANSSNSNYLWSSGVTTQTVSVNTSSIVVTTTNACGSAQATQTINIVPIPTVSLSSNALTLCSGQSATVQANSNTPVTYTWSTGVNTNTVSLNTIGVYTVNVSNACGSATSTVDVVVSSSPTISASATQTLLCQGQTSVLSLTGSVGTYLWSNGATTATTNVTNTGVYTGTVTTSCGTAISSVTIATQVTPTISVSASALTICSGQSSTLTAISNVANYSWSNGVFNNTTVVNTSGIFTVSVSNNCGVATETINITTGILPVLTLTPSSVLICPNETATLTVSGGSSPYSWSNSSSTGSVVITNGGTVTVSNTNACGTSSAITVVDVTNLNADFTANPVSGTLPVVVSFTNNTTGANSFAWNFGNGNSATSQNVSTETYSAVGIYTVYLTAFNGSCSDTYSLMINVFNEEATLVVPNVFTPNGDGSNDLYRISGKNIIEFNCTIFDRWGLQMYYWDDIRNGWDGTNANKMVPDGTYFYIINAKDIDYKEIKKQGFLQLFQ